MPWTCFRGRIGVKNTKKIHPKHPDELLEPRRIGLSLDTEKVNAHTKPDSWGNFLDCPVFWIHIRGDLYNVD